MNQTTYANSVKQAQVSYLPLISIRALGAVLTSENIPATLAASAG